MTREIMNQDDDNMNPVCDNNNDDHKKFKGRNTNDPNENHSHHDLNECDALLKRQQLIFAQLLREAKRQEERKNVPRRPRSVSGYQLFRLEHGFVGLKEWNALPLATQARYHELAAETIRAYKERLRR